MKVIFLDIDGVMNSTTFYHNRYNKITNLLKRYINLIISKIKFIIGGCKHKSLLYYKTPKSYYTFNYQFKRLMNETCPEKWKWLREFCNDNDVKICISSTWKNHFRDEENTLPERWDEALNKIGFKPNTFVGITGSRRNLRGEEIQEWLNMHPEVLDYAILDDDSDMLPTQMKKFYHCDGWFGMSPNHLYKIKRQFDGVTARYEEVITKQEDLGKELVEYDDKFKNTVLYTEFS